MENTNKNTKAMMKNEQVINGVKAALDKANAALQAATGGGTSYAFEDVKIALATDEAGLYLTSGQDQILATNWIKKDGNSVQKTIAHIQDVIAAVVKSTVDTIASRRAEREAARALLVSDEKISKAAKDRTESGIDPDAVLAKANPFASEMTRKIAAAVREMNKAFIQPAIASRTVSYGTAKFRILGTSSGFIVKSGKFHVLHGTWATGPKAVLEAQADQVIGLIQSEVDDRLAFMARRNEASDEADKLHAKASLARAATEVLAALEA